MDRRVSTYSSVSSSSSSSSNSSISTNQQRDERSLYSNLFQCQLALQRLQNSSKSTHPLIENLIRQMEDQIAFCLPACGAGGSKKSYTYIFDILEKMNRSVFDNRLTLYFNRSPYWQHFYINIGEIRSTLAACCSGRTKNGQASLEFRRKFTPMADVTLRRLDSFGAPIAWKTRTVPASSIW